MNKLEGSQRVFQNITNKLCVSIEKFGVSLELLDGICVHWKKDAKNKRIDNNQFDLQDFETCLDIISKHFVKNVFLKMGLNVSDVLFGRKSKIILPFTHVVHWI